MISMEPNTTQVNTENRDVLRLSLAAGQWQFINMFAQQLITIGTFLVLARILLPQYFGVAVLIALVPTFIDGITSFAFETSALQKKEGMRPYLDVIWTFNILRTLVILLISFIAAPFVADFFHIEYALPALYMAGLVVFAQNLTNIGKAKSLAMLATSPIISSINKVSFSSYLHVRDSLPHIGEGISKTFEILFAIGLPYVLAIVFAGNRLVL